MEISNVYKAVKSAAQSSSSQHPQKGKQNP